jgi:hypothetical protein
VAISRLLTESALGRSVMQIEAATEAAAHPTVGALPGTEASSTPKPLQMQTGTACAASLEEPAAAHKKAAVAVLQHISAAAASAKAAQKQPAGLSFVDADALRRSVHEVEQRCQRRGDKGMQQGETVLALAEEEVQVERELVQVLLRPVAPTLDVP